jgi:hypothetical protein
MTDSSSLKPFHSLISGISGGVVCTVVCAPLDLARVILFMIFPPPFLSYIVERFDNKLKDPSMARKDIQVQFKPFKVFSNSKVLVDYLKAWAPH